MYIFLKRLLRELFTAIIIAKADKVCEEELVDDKKIKQEYGICTYVLKLHDTDFILTMSNCVRIFILILGIGSIIGLIVLTFCLGIAPSEQRWVYALIPLAYIFLLICIKVHKDIYKYYRNIVTRDKIIIRRAYKIERIVTYEEISNATKKKKIVIRKGVIYVPTSRKSVRIGILGDIYGELALEQIKEKSKIAIPEITEKRKKYMGQASLCGLFYFFSYLLIFAAICAAALRNDNGLDGYIINLITKDYCLLFLGLGIFGIMIGKIYFMLGQYKLRKDINDRKHVKIRLL